MSDTPNDRTDSLERLLEVMARLRDPEGGCPWDIEQSYETIAPYTIEEAYEVADAIERRDFEGLKEELGDLRSVVYGKDGILAGLGKGGIFVDHTTASAEVAREIYAAAKKAGIAAIDGPVSGGQAGAEDGVLTVM